MLIYETCHIFCHSHIIVVRVMRGIAMIPQVLGFLLAVL
jgi:hypothetical protein